MRIIRHTTAATACFLALCAGLADARTPKDLWATVNICDTKRSPDRLGLRARMPGNGTHQRMYMRFVVQYRDGKEWKNLGGNGRSPWLYAGSALFKNREFGYTIPFRPDAGDSYRLRGP